MAVAELDRENASPEEAVCRLAALSQVLRIDGDPCGQGLLLWPILSSRRLTPHRELP